MFGKKPEAEPSHHYSTDLLEDEREALIDVLNGKTVPYTIKDRLRTKLIHSTRHSGPPLQPGKIDWAEAERLAERRGESLVDLIWDLSKGREGR